MEAHSLWIFNIGILEMLAFKYTAKKILPRNSLQKKLL